MTKYSKMLEAYRSRWGAVDYTPLHIYVEPTNECNLNCAHCMRDLMTRQTGFMDTDLYAGVIGQASDMGIEWVYLFGDGEPLLHPDIEQMVELARYVGVKTRVHTNGTLPITIKPDRLVISANSTPWERIRANIPVGVHYEIHAIDGVVTDIPEELVVRPRHHWHSLPIGGVRPDELWAGMTPCSQPYKTMKVNWDGSVSLCCMDYNAECTIWNANDLADAWNSAWMYLYRFAGSRICDTCDMERLPLDEKC